MRIIYTIGIWFYTVGVRIAALCGHRNAALMVKGWKAEWTVESGRWVWFHAASLGEFEQARPVLEAFRQRHPEYKVLVTFFSPSGYEVRKNYAQADKVMYLPMDLPGNVRRLLDAVKPEMVFFVKYEFWFNYLDALRKRNIPTYIFSTIFRPGQYFFKWYGRWFRQQLKACFSHLFVQNEESLHLLQSHGIEHCSIAGDTRFDRVHQIAEAAERDATVDAFLDGHQGKVLVCGSTWPPDEELITQSLNHPVTQSLKIILAPHVISEEHLQQIEKLFPDSIRYSATQSLSHSATPRILIIDNIGLLSKLYRYADVAYIGGGFGVGIHNILEAVTFGKPVFFGPNYQKFQEARDIISRGGGWSITSAHELETLMQQLTDSETYQKAIQACRDYMQENLGSTGKILETIEKRQ